MTFAYQFLCSYVLIRDFIEDFAFSYVNQQFLRLTEVFSYLYIIHLYLSISRSIDVGPAFSIPVKFGLAFSTPAFSASP